MNTTKLADRFYKCNKVRREAERRTMAERERQERRRRKAEKTRPA